MKHAMKNVSGRLVGGILLLAGVAAVFLYEVKPAEEAEDQMVRPIKSMIAGAGTVRPTLFFPGTIEPDTEVDLSFEVGGRLIEFPVRRGMVVAKGDLLARLDPSNYENQVRNVEAELELARSSLARIERALAVNAVSQDEFARAKAAVQKAEAQLAIQRKALADTELFAAFAGRISDTLANNFDSVAPGRPVVKLQDIERLAISVSIPERYIMMTRDNYLVNTTPGVIFDSVPGLRYPATVKEFATVADPVTRTFRVRFTFHHQGEFFLLPGMTGTVVLDGNETPDAALALMVPSDAVGVTVEGQAFVWVLEPGGEGVYQARRRMVETGQRNGAMIAITAGLEKGTRIASAGVAILTEGRRVRLLEAVRDTPVETAR